VLQKDDKTGVHRDHSQPKKTRGTVGYGGISRHGKRANMAADAQTILLRGFPCLT
jgi:hypothetical protein